jgi:hypothetical protein
LGIAVHPVRYGISTEVSDMRRLNGFEKSLRPPETPLKQPSVNISAGRECRDAA